MSRTDGRTVSLWGAVGWAVLAALLGAAISGLVNWWVGLLVAVVVAVPFFTPISGMWAGAWLLLWWRFRGRRKRPRTTPAAFDVQVQPGSCGVRWDDGEVISMVELGPDVRLPTVVDPAGGLFTEDVVPLGVISTMLSQTDLQLGIDIVSSGARVPTATAYSTLYADQLVHPALVGRRRTWLTVRLPISENLTSLRRRGPIQRSAPAAAAVAAHRLATRLRAEGHHATPVSAEGIDIVVGQLLGGDGSTLADWSEEWDHLHNPHTNEKIAAYYIGENQCTTETLTGLWASSAENVTTTLSLRKRADGGLSVSGSARYLFLADEEIEDHRPGLTSAEGHQLPLLISSLPIARDPHESPSAATDLTQPEAIPQMMVGAAGQAIGVTADGATLVWPLVDQSIEHPMKLNVHAELTDTNLNQVLLRAAAIGTRIDVYTTEPARWRAFADRLTPQMKIYRPDSTAGTGDLAVVEAGTSPAATPTVITVGDVAPRGRIDVRFSATASGAISMTSAVGGAELAVQYLRGEEQFLTSINDTSPRQRPAATPAVPQAAPAPVSPPPTVAAAPPVTTTAPAVQAPPPAVSAAPIHQTPAAPAAAAPVQAPATPVRPGQSPAAHAGPQQPRSTLLDGQRPQQVVPENEAPEERAARMEQARRQMEAERQATRQSGNPARPRHRSGT